MPHRKYFQNLTQRKFSLSKNNFLIPEARQFIISMMLQDLKEENQQYLWIAQDETQANQIHGRILTWISLLELSSSLRYTIDKLTSGNFQPLQRFHQNKIKLLIVPKDSLEINIPTPQEVTNIGIHLKVGHKIELHTLYKQLQDIGYLPQDIVDRPQQIAKRGGIIDIFHPRRDLPIRIEFWGTEITSMRYFDPLTQRSLTTKTNHIQEVDLPALHSKKFHGQLTDYLQSDTTIIIEKQLSSKLKQIQNYAQYQFKPDLLLTKQEINQEAPGHYDFESIPTIQGKMRDLYQLIIQKKQQNHTICIISNQAERLKNSFEEAQHTGRHQKLFDKHQDLNFDHLYFIQAPENNTPVIGFQSQKLNLTILTDYEIFGLVQAKTSIAGYKTHYKNFLNSINIGDIVVHADHGICLLKDTLTMEAAGMTREYLLLEFAAQDKIYLPTTQMFKLSKYIGQDSDQVPLSKLGSKQWNKRRHKAEVDTAQIAKELIDLYAKRHLKAGFKFPPDDYLMREFEASFPYLETPDQLKAINEIKNDMESTKTMDRLICGDVGFGKTEVAMRAAFKAVVAGKQVCFLSPTTILAEQHYHTMQERYQDFDVKVEMLSRFHSQTHNKKILKKLNQGQIDIIIGTHRLFSKDVKFKNLGLIIIDEEQRFGVKQKEHLKKLRTEVDILSLSATPIPRTLNLSLIGIRDLSMITTPPKGRRPVETIVAHLDEHLMRQAIEKEIERQGQIFVVYNRVASLENYARKIIELIPNVRITTAHGQMDPDQLEEKMYAFVHGKIDILVSSTIIENGVDIPNANTIIVIGAENFGLASLYQLRGRVGRSDRQGYAYFFHKKHELSTISWHRLKALKDNSHLGAGMNLAMRDLEIRGAGNILGLNQSGHIEGVGFELYSRLLKRAINIQRQVIDKDRQYFLQDSIEIQEVTVDLPLSAFIPDNYLQSKKEKMSLYQRISEIETLQELKSIQEEATDRFGKPPLELINLFKLSKLRIEAASCGIEKISIINDQLCFDFKLQEPQKHLKKIQKILPEWKRDKQQFKIPFALLKNDWLAIIELSLKAMKKN